MRQDEGFGKQDQGPGTKISGVEGEGTHAAAYEPEDGSIEDPELERVLREFRLSVHAWSEAANNRPRVMIVAPRRTAWRRAAAWSLGSVLALGTAGGGVLEYQHRQEQARIAAAREAEHQRQLMEQRAREAEEELAKVDSEVARQVPHALEPLVQWMSEDDTQ
jgi:uncharacterized protein HemX